MPQFRQFFNILIFSSVASMAFGVVFGEFFGHEFYEPLISRNPRHDFNPLIVAAVFIGVAHLNAGLITGFVNELRSHGFRHALFAKLSWIVLQLGAAFIVLSFM